MKKEVSSKSAQLRKDLSKIEDGYMIMKDGKRIKIDEHNNPNQLEK